jgi:hypothetical protein
MELATKSGGGTEYLDMIKGVITLKSERDQDSVHHLETPDLRGSGSHSNS